MRVDEPSRVPPPTEAAPAMLSRPHFCRRGSRSSRSRRLHRAVGDGVKRLERSAFGQWVLANHLISNPAARTDASSNEGLAGQGL
jgi:hypothetical protein